MNSKKLYALKSLKETFEQLPQIRKLGIQIVEYERGHCLFKIDYALEFIGNRETGLIHGGIITTLLDSVGGAAAFSIVQEGSSVATLDLRLDYLTQAESGEPIMGFAESYHQTRNVVFVRGYAYHHSAEKPIVNFVASFMIGSVGFSPNV
ncbi:MAG: PaaI family thioesterase [Gammaproteobacteria bacterium]|nr:PaaI family thioesterase [Gammaproteobacteria bacterium]MCP5443336.1 PaaI family thioesterase [Chromatiaceae bacterium]